MSSPVVDRVRTIPLAVEKEVPMEAEEISGYPFNRDSDRDGYLRSQLDDIAKRHPELAEHLGNFQQRPNQSHPHSADEQDLHRRFPRHFGDRFERFGFPFDKEDFDPEEYAQQFYRPPHQEFYQQQPTQEPSYHQQSSSYHEHPDAQECRENQHSSYADNSAKAPTQEDDNRNIQQSNSTDLGQAQEPFNDRNQRSMSEPPVNKGQRFTSSINIPVNQPNHSENMSNSSENKGTERIIPIHIEGRDEPVMPKNVPPTQQHQSFTGPQPERIFGQRPEQFTQFLNREPRQFADNWHHSFPEEHVRQQRFQPQHSAPPHHYQHQNQQQKPHHQEEISIPVQREIPKQRQQNKQQQQQQPKPQRASSPQPEPPKPAPQQPKVLSPIEQIQVIQKDVSELMLQVEKFDGKPKDKQYLYLDEMFTRNLLKLDNIDTQGQESIRNARKEAIKCIEKAISVLETKAVAANEPPKIEEKMEVEEKPEGTSTDVKEEKPQKEENQTEQPPKPIEENEPSSNPSDSISNENKPITESAAVPMEEEPVVQSESENKPKQENSQPMEAQPESPPKPVELETTEEKKDINEEAQMEKPEAVPKSEQNETNEDQEKNMTVADAVIKFEGNPQEPEKKDEKTSSLANNDKETDESKQETSEAKPVKEKKEKKKGKKKVVEKKE